MEFTREQLIAKAREQIEFCRNTKITGEGRVHVNQCLALFEIALASLEAEAAITVGDDGGDALAYRRLIQTFAPGTKLYTAPPTPVSVPDALEDDIHSDDHPLLWSYNNGWNACRAAMLQGAENAGAPTTMQTAPVLDSSPKNAESTSGINQGKSEPVTTGCKLRDAVETIRNSGIAIDAEKILAERDALNAPVIPDGWVMVPVEPTAEMLQSGISAHYERSQIQIHDRPAPGPMECAYIAMILAAQQEEAKVSSPVITDGLNIRAVAALRETVRNQWLKSDNLADKIYWKSMLDIANEIISSMLPTAPQQEVK